MLLTSLRDESKQTLRDNKGDTTKELYVRIGHPQPPAVYIVRGLAPSPDSSSSNPFDLSTGYEPGTLKPSATLRASKGPVTTMSNHTDDPQQPKRRKLPLYLECYERPGDVNM